MKYFKFTFSLFFLLTHFQVLADLPSKSPDIDLLFQGQGREGGNKTGQLFASNIFRAFNEYKEFGLTTLSKEKLDELEKYIKGKPDGLPLQVFTTTEKLTKEVLIDGQIVTQPCQALTIRQSKVILVSIHEEFGYQKLSLTEQMSKAFHEALNLKKYEKTGDYTYSAEYKAKRMEIYPELDTENSIAVEDMNIREIESYVSKKYSVTNTKDLYRILNTNASDKTQPPSFDKTVMVAKTMIWAVDYLLARNFNVNPMWVHSPQDIKTTDNIRDLFSKWVNYIKWKENQEGQRGDKRVQRELRKKFIEVIADVTGFIYQETNFHYSTDLFFSSDEVYHKGDRKYEIETIYDFAKILNATVF